MAWTFKSTQLGLAPITSTTTAPTVSANMTNSNTPAPAGRSTPGRLGAVAIAYDPTFGEAEFIYLVGCANTVAGLMVNYNATTFQTTLSSVTANDIGPVAVAMSANVAGQYGWYMIEGLATIKKTAVKVTPQGKIYQSATAGRVMQTSATGNQILGARGANLTTVTSTTSTVVVLINRPSKQGQIT